MALAGYRHAGSRPHHRLAAGFQRRRRAAQGVFFEALEECGDDVGAGDDLQLVGDGGVCLWDYGHDLVGCVDHQCMFGADGSGVGGRGTAARDEVFIEGAETVEAYVECGEWD